MLSQMLSNTAQNMFGHAEERRGISVSRQVITGEGLESTVGSAKETEFSDGKERRYLE